MQPYTDQSNSYDTTVASHFIRSVYSYMFIALSISGVIAYAVGTNRILFESLFVSETGKTSMLFYVVLFAPIVLAMVIQWGFQKLSMSTLLLLFILYSACMGSTLSVIFMAYSTHAIVFTFFVSSAAFGGMAILGYTTKTDLTKFGSLLYMVLIGMIIGGIVNMFLGSGLFDLLITLLGVFVFTGLIAYQMQQLKRVAFSSEFNEETKNKLALIGGMQLYILFVNLFLTLLRLLGNRD